jgi:lysophospholipase
MKLVEFPDNPPPPGGETTSVVTPDGIRLRTARWPAIGAARGTVLLVQGRTEFIEKYFETIGDLRRRGFAVVAFDWRGQGGSERLVARGCHIEHYTDYDRDLDAVMSAVVRPHCPPPVTAIAHSMGALACLRAAHDRRADFARMVLLAPMLRLSPLTAPPMAVTRFLTGLGLFFGRDTRPVANRALRERDEPEDQPRQRMLDALLKSAPELKSGWPTVRWIYSAARAMQESEAPDFAAAIDRPVLLVTAGRDRIVSNDAVAALARRLPNAVNAVIAEAGHEVLMESEAIREEFWAAFDAFVADHGG